jgi:hypothetical protein
MGIAREPGQEEEVGRARDIVAVANYTTMKFLVFSSVTFCLLAGCTSVSGTQQAVPSLVTSVATDGSTASMQTQGPAELVNLSYSDGSITVFAVQNGRAKVSTRFTPGHGRAQGLAVDKSGRIYTTISSSNSNPCLACIEIFTPAGKMVRRVEAPILPSAPGPPSLTDISVDAHENVYVSDYGQQAVYFFHHGGNSGSPVIVVQNSNNAASVLSTPNGTNVVVSGGCGFASVRPYTRIGPGQYQPGSCFGIGTIALIGGSADNQTEVLTPVDGVPALVSVSSPSGGASFTTPDRLASISGVALSGDASIAYVANAHKQCVYVFARPSKGWIAGGQPKLLATDKGFKNLDIIAVRP